jgi:ubiquitin conjugation factor E4 B
MAPPGRSVAETEDFALRRILNVTLTYAQPSPQKHPHHEHSPIYLEQLAAELLSESKPLVLSRDVLERVVIDRLSNPPHGAEPPMLYLLGCYRRAVEESRKVQGMKDKRISSEILDSISQVKDLAVSYVGIMLEQPDMFPSPLQSNKDGLISSPSRQSIATLILGDANSHANGLGNNCALPSGFLDHFIKRFENEPGFDNIWRPAFEDLRSSVTRVSPLGPFQTSLKTLIMLVSYPSVAKALVNHPNWLPRGLHINGRVLEINSILGPFFHISVIPDNPIFGNGEPNVG